MTPLQRLITRSLMACLLPIAGIYFIYLLFKGIIDNEFPMTTLTWIALAILIQSIVVLSMVQYFL